MNPSTTAHLDRKTRLKCLCGVCGNVICTIGPIKAGRRNEDGSPARHLIFEPGWVVDPDGSWRMTSHAKNRVRLGKPSAPRRAPVAFLGNERGHIPRTPRALPIQAECGTCGAVNRLDPVTLDVAVYPEPGLYPDTGREVVDP